MNFEELWKETGERGFTDMVEDSTQLPRLKRWVNEAYRELADVAPWPFLDASKEGAAPLTIADFAHIESVTAVASDTVLQFADPRMISGFDPTRDDTGSPEFWYLEGETTVKVWPADGGTVLVRYVKAVTELSAAGDVPLIPAMYQDLIVDGAVIRCLRNRDNYQAAQFIRQEWDRGVKGMVHALLRPNYDGYRTIIRTGGVEDYLG